MSNQDNLGSREEQFAKVEEGGSQGDTGGWWPVAEHLTDLACHCTVLHQCWVLPMPLGECELGKIMSIVHSLFSQGGPHIEAQQATVAMGVYMQAG